MMLKAVFWYMNRRFKYTKSLKKFFIKTESFVQT